MSAVRESGRRIAALLALAGALGLVQIPVSLGAGGRLVDRLERAEQRAGAVERHLEAARAERREAAGPTPRLDARIERLERAQNRALTARARLAGQVAEARRRAFARPWAHVAMQRATPRLGSRGLMRATTPDDERAVLGAPLWRPATLIGVPFAGTHTLGNWQSDRALDLYVPVGTPVRAVEDGVVLWTARPRSRDPRFAGARLTLHGRVGEYFYTHLSRLRVRPGQQVRRGQVLGRSGTANATPHLHFAARVTDPLVLVGLRDAPGATGRSVEAERR